MPYDVLTLEVAATSGVNWFNLPVVRSIKSGRPAWNEIMGAISTCARAVLAIPSTTSIKQQAKERIHCKNTNFKNKARAFESDARACSEKRRDLVIPHVDRSIRTEKDGMVRVYIDNIVPIAGTDGGFSPAPAT